MNRKKIFPFGLGFIILLSFCIFFTLMGGYVIANFFLPGEMYQSWGVLLVGIIGEGICIYEFINLFKKAPVIFDENNNIINKGKNPNFFPPFCVDCKEIMDYKFTHLMAATCIEFTLKNNKKIRLHCMQFTKKQACQILKEIQIRGGLQNKEIVIKFK